MKRSSITFTDNVSTHRPVPPSYRLLRGFFSRILLLSLLIGAGYLAIRYDVAGVGRFLPFQTVLSGKLNKAEAYLLERLDNPSTYKSLEWGPMEKRYDYGQLGDVFVTWVAYEFQDDFGNVKRQKAFFKIDAATGKTVDFKIQ